MKYDDTRDGLDFINMYSNGRTALGKMISNFYHFPFNTKDFGYNDGTFASNEAYWYYLSLNPKFKKKDSIRNLYGALAKKTGRTLRKECEAAGLPLNKDPLFQQKICAAVWNKIMLNHDLILPEYVDLPIVHYYEFPDKTTGDPVQYDVTMKFPWLTKCAFDAIQNAAKMYNIK